MKSRSGIQKRALLRDEAGLTTVEYVIILALIAIVCIAAWDRFGQAVRTKAAEGEENINLLEEGAAQS